MTSLRHFINLVEAAKPAPAKVSYFMHVTAGRNMADDQAALPSSKAAAEDVREMLIKLAVAQHPEKTEQDIRQRVAGLSSFDVKDMLKNYQQKAKEKKAVGEAMSSEAFAKLLADTRAKTAQRNAMADDLSASGKPVRFTKASGWNALAGPDVSVPGGFRLTEFDGAIPNNHTEFPTLRDAIIDALKDGYQPK